MTQDEQDQQDEREMFTGLDDLTRWQNVNYLMRHDEIEGVCEILNAASDHSQFRNLLFVPNHYHALAQVIREIDWDIPFLKVVASAENSNVRNNTPIIIIPVLTWQQTSLNATSLFGHLAYYASRESRAHYTEQRESRKALDAVFFFHYDNSRHHWLLFCFECESGEILCLEPLGHHPTNKIDVTDMWLIGNYFSPHSDHYDVVRVQPFELYLKLMP